MKVFDCFKIFNEIELLELRLRELNDVVDYFVIVEANKTHTGKPKTFIVQECEHLFADYIKKIIYVRVTDLPYNPNNIWLAENHQRNCILNGLQQGGAAIGDKVIVSDIDEIPNPEAIKANLDKKEWVTLQQDLFYYYVNCRQNQRWDGPVMANYGTFFKPQDLRDARGQTPHVEKNGGWHYSFMGGAARILTKVQNIAESPLIIDKIGSEEEVAKKMQSQADLWDRTEDFAKKQIIDISNNKPKYMDWFLSKYPNFFYEQKH